MNKELSWTEAVGVALAITAIMLTLIFGCLLTILLMNNDFDRIAWHKIAGSAVGIATIYFVAYILMPSKKSLDVPA